MFACTQLGDINIVLSHLLTCDHSLSKVNIFVFFSKLSSYCTIHDRKYSLITSMTFVLVTHRARPVECGEAFIVMT